MSDFKLKLILSILGGIVFSFIFILLAFTLPLDRSGVIERKSASGLLEAVSHSIKK